MTVFTAVFAFKGANDKISRLTFKTPDIGGLVPDAFADAVARATALRTALNTISDAPVVEVTILYPAFEASDAGAGDVFEKALLVTRIPSTEDASKTANVTVPAPSIGIFQGATGVDRDRIDITDADLLEFISELSDNWTVSDGEVIDVTTSGGLVSGKRIVTRVQLG